MNPLGGNIQSQRPEGWECCTVSGYRCTEKGLGSYWAGDVGGDKLNGMPIRWPMLNSVGRGESWKVNEQKSDVIREVF